MLFRPTASSQGKQIFVAVQRGKISKSISLSGSVALTSQISVTSPVSGKVSAVLVQKGDIVSEGQELIRLDLSDLEEQISNAQLNLEIAQLKLEQLKEPVSEADLASSKLSLEKAKMDVEIAQNNLTRVTETCSLSLAAAQESVKSAQQDLEDAQANLDMTKEVTRLALESAQSAVDSAEQNLEEASDESTRKAAESSLEQAKQKLESQKLSNQQQIDSAESKFKSAQLSLAKAEQSVEQKILDNQSSLENAKNQVKSAEYGLQSAQLQYEQKIAPPSSIEVSLQEKSVAQAQLSLNKLLQLRSSSVIVAPQAGTVGQVSVEIGQSISANASLITLLDVHSLEVSANIPEVNISQVHPGMGARVTADSMPDKTFTATLNTIEPLASETQGVVSYKAHFSLVNEAISSLKQGMTVELELIVAQTENALLVPRSALQTMGSNYFVMIQDGQSLSTRRVEVGIMNDQMVEVKSGLDGSEQIALTTEGGTTQLSTTPSGFPGGRNREIPGGGFTIPMGPGPGD